MKIENKTPEVFVSDLTGLIWTGQTNKLPKYMTI